MPSLPMPIAHRYLWAQGSVSVAPGQGTLVAERYRVVAFPLLLDTTPGESPAPLETVPEAAKPYLALSPFVVAIPRPFTQVVIPETGETLLLLEAVPVGGPEPAAEAPALLPSLPTAWADATALQQMGWLWQIANLWQPCLNQQVAASLLDWQNLRVDAEDIRLVTLTTMNPAPTLMDLGNQWQSLVPAATPAVQPYLTELTQVMLAGQCAPIGLLRSLTQALEAIAADQEILVQWATGTDQGPTRQRNEDACYPPGGSSGNTLVKAAHLTTTPAPFVVVCDGIGGHQGGDVASQLAIQEVTQQLQSITATANLPHTEIVAALKQAIWAANQTIATQNNEAQRQSRDRMGTTIVIALVYGARLYIAHLGDSRAYRVRSQACRQITLDDDVATREMRLGLELYQDALQLPGSGSLVQAVGMADSRHLHPTVTLYPLALNSLVLLCSDGLSDYDLIERVWPSELQPVLMGDRTVAIATQRLIELANTQNGHDNVTVGLLHLQPQRPLTLAPIPADLAQIATEPGTLTPTEQPPSGPAKVTRSQSPGWRPLPSLIAGGLVVLVMGCLGFLAWQWLMRRPAILQSAQSPNRETLSPDAAPPSSSSDLTTGTLSVGDYLQVRQIPDTQAPATILIAPSPPEPQSSDRLEQPERLLPVGSIIQVVNRQRTPNDQRWVRLEVCSVSTANPDTLASPEGVASAAADTSAIAEGDRPVPLATPGDQGWLLETSLPIFADQLIDTSFTQQGLCTD